MERASNFRRAKETKWFVYENGNKKFKNANARNFVRNQYFLMLCFVRLEI